MFNSQIDLDNSLDREHAIQVVVDHLHPLPNNTPAYEKISGIEQTGFSFTPRDLLHAIGCKTAALPSSKKDECIKSAWLYVNILDLQGDHLSFHGDYGADLQTPRSQEIGIGFTCLIGERYFGIPWDQLGPLPGTGKRFDYRGSRDGLDGIFEAKGTSHQSNQITQIKSGIEKKEAHHERNEHFDVELIVSAFIGRNNDSPRIVLADPDKSSLSNLYRRGDVRYYRLKHYCRVLQFIGLPESAYYLNRFATDYLDNKNSINSTILPEKSHEGLLTSIKVNNETFLGRWFTSWLPKDSRRYKSYERYDDRFSVERFGWKEFRVFQGVLQEVYRSGMGNDPFSHKLLTSNEIVQFTDYGDSKVSVFPDGTILIFKLG